MSSNSDSESNKDSISSDSKEDEQLPPASPSPGDKDSSTSHPITRMDHQSLKTDHSRKRRRRSRPSTVVLNLGTGADFRQRVLEFTGFQSNRWFPGFQYYIAPEEVSEDLFAFISHWSLFPLGSGFTKQDLVSLWIAEGLVRTRSVQAGRVEEDVANDIFDLLVSRDVIVPFSFDKSVDFFNPKVRKSLYKVNEPASLHPSFKPALCNNKYATVSDNDFDHVPETVLHLSVLCKTVNRMNFEAMKRFVHLRTLFLIPYCGFFFEQIPRDLFLWLKNLRSLNMSRSLVAELPNSIGNLKSLMYIDLSYTPIKHLPDSMDTLHNLQTLKLRFCFNLFALPKNMRKLTNLRHLDFDIMGQLKSMPTGMGNLTNLQTLSAFLVGKDDGNKIVELKNTTNLTGAFCISRLDNVSSFEEAKDAGLINKRFLKKLELRWTDRRIDIDNATMEEERKIIEHLQPPLGIEELRVLHYCGSKLPSWISNPSYVSLVDITLCGCRNCEFLPSFGELPSLQILNIKEMNELKRINRCLCRNDCDQQNQNQAFPRLKKLTIEAMLRLEGWTGIQNGDFPVLQALKVEHCPQLMSLPLLSYLYSLKHLELSYCPNILALPDQDLPSSLEYFLMKDCPQLKKRCHKGEGQDWGKMTHVPNILVDYERISWQVNMPVD